MQEAARKLRMSYRHVKRLVSSGRIQVRRRGREKMISMKELLRFMGGGSR
jgi:excisionase family DNA binding protein